MTLADMWSTYLAVLCDRAPVTAASIRPPRTPTDVAEAETLTGPWNDEVREFYLLQDGQEAAHAGGTEPGEVLPELRLLSLDEIVGLHNWWLRNPHSTESLGPNWHAEIEAQSAGESAAKFLPQYIPVAEGLGGSFAYVDTRSGPRSGCVRYFSAESADEGTVAYESLSEFLQQVTESVQTGSAQWEMVPLIEDGILLWEEDPDS